MRSSAKLNGEFHAACATRVSTGRSSTSAFASGVSSSLGGTSCQNNGRNLSQLARISFPLLLPVSS